MTKSPGGLSLIVILRNTIIVIFVFILVIILFTTIFFSFGKINFWLSNKTKAPVTVVSCSFEGKKLSNCPSVIPELGTLADAMFETETVFSLNRKKVYSLDLDLIVNGKSVRETIRFRKMGGYCVEMVAIDTENKVHGDSVCMNPAS